MASSASARLLDTDNHLRRGLDSPRRDAGLAAEREFLQARAEGFAVQVDAAATAVGLGRATDGGYQPVASALLPPAEFSLARSVIGVPSR